MKPLYKKTAAAVSKWNAADNALGAAETAAQIESAITACDLAEVEVLKSWAREAEIHADARTAQIIRKEIKKLCAADWIFLRTVVIKIEAT